MSVVKGERRHARRIQLSIPTLVEVIGQRQVELHPNLAKVYERVMPPDDMVGRKFPAVLRDLSTNGAFLTGPPMVLLARVAFTFPLEGFGQVEALGWTLWRRSADCEIPRDGDTPVTLLGGFGLLFESIPLGARQVIANMVERRQA
jgi:hypothetical protein